MLIRARIWCTWGDLVVTAEAATGSLLTNEEAHDMGARALVREPGRWVDGIGDEARQGDYDGEDEQRVLTVRFDNLLVGVSQALPDGADRASLDARARTLAVAARDALR